MDQVYDMELNQGRLEEMRAHFLRYMNGFTSFKECGEKYQVEERAYKDELASIFRQEVMPLFEPFSGDTSSMGEQQAEEAVHALHHLLAKRGLENRWKKRPQNLLLWRELTHLTSITGDDAITAAAAFANLIQGSEGSPDRLGQFLETYRPILSRHKKGSVENILRRLPTLLLMLIDSNRDLIVQITRLNKASSALINRKLLPDGPLTAGQYTECLEFARKLFDAIAVWSPRDMIDIQSFIWVYGEPAKPLEERDKSAVNSDSIAYVQSPVVDIPGIVGTLQERGIRLSERTVRRYHAALRARKFVILSGVSGTGKTWLAELYAEVVGARKHIERVAPNWHSNEDLLGFVSPINNHYHDTEFSRFIREAAQTWGEG